MADRILNIGFIGNGKGTNRYHAPFSLALPDKFRIKTIQARHLGGPWPQIPGVEYTTDMAAMLADPAIDVVEISTPHSTHYALTKAALEAGKHVVCDKAFVGTVAEAEELFALAAEKGVTVQCYQNRRFDSDLLTAKKVVESGKLGEVFVAASTSFTCIVMVGIAGLHSIKAEYAVLYHQYRTSATHSRGCGRNPGHELHQLWPAQIAGILTQGNSATTPAL